MIKKEENLKLTTYDMWNYNFIYLRRTARMKVRTGMAFVAAVATVVEVNFMATL